MAISHDNALERLLSRLQHDPFGGCWLFDGYWMPAGYGQFYMATGDPILAHRASWTLHMGPIPVDMNVLHKCDVPPCFRPDHLFLGTQQDNVDDMIAKGRKRWLVKQGDEHASSILTSAQVLDIRARYSRGDMTQIELAREHTVTQSTISAIICRKSWAHI